MTDENWVAVPKGGGRGRGKQRLAMASLDRNTAGGRSRDRISIHRSLLAAIGSPTTVALLADPDRGRIALRGDGADGERVVVLPPPPRMNAAIIAVGLAEMMGWAGRDVPIRLRAAIKGDLILMEPIALPEPCAACGGKGVKP